MAGNPYDYAGPLLGGPQVNPAQAVAQGMQVGNGLVDAQRQTTLFDQAQQDRQRAIDAATAKAVADAKLAAQMRADFDAAAADGSVESNLALMAKYPQLADNLKKRHDALSEQRKADALRQNVTMSAAIMNGEPLVAADYARRDATALEKTDPAAAESLRRMADLIDAHPEKANVLLQSYVTANGGKEAVEALQKVQGGDAALAKATADAAKATTEAKVLAETALDEAIAKIDLTKEQASRLKAQTKYDADRLGFDYYKLGQEMALARAALTKTDTKKSPQQQKEINDAVDAGVQANLSATAAEDLAAKFDDVAKTPTFSGISGKAVEAINEATGFTNDLSAIRKQFKSVVNQDVLKNLPPGAASDTDVALMREGFPAATDDPKRIADFLRAQARVTRSLQKIKEARAEYINQNGDLGPVKEEVILDGKIIPKGMRFDQAIAAGSIKAAPAKDTTSVDALFGVSGG